MPSSCVAAPGLRGPASPKSKSASTAVRLGHSPSLNNAAVGKWAWIGWSFSWEDVTPGQYTLRCRAKDERGNMSSNPDDYVHDYYAMDNTKPQCVDVNVYPKGTLTGRKSDRAPHPIPVALRAAKALINSSASARKIRAVARGR